MTAMMKMSFTALSCVKCPQSGAPAYASRQRSIRKKENEIYER
jgi:hypothetical protein